MRAMTVTALRRWPLPVVLVAVLILAVVVGAAIYIAQPPGRTTGGRPAAQPTTGAPAATDPASPTTSASPADTAGIGDGIYEVGREIQAGVYTTTAPAGRVFGCYWARLRSFGQPDSIIADHNLEPGETARVTVRASDRGFKVSNGCTWYPVL